MNSYNYPFQGYIGGQSLIRVNGIDGAKAYQMQPNSTVALFDNAEDLFYIKQTDGAGFPVIRTFGFSEITQKENKSDHYVSRKELEEYVEQFIQQPKKPTNTQPRTNGNN